MPYSLDEFESVLPPLPKPSLQKTMTPLPPAGARTDRIVAYVVTWPGVPEGQRNSEAERHAACLTHDFALSKDEAWLHLCAWNAKNDPPLDEEELRKCLESGFRYGSHPVGEKLTALPFKHLLPATNGNGQVDNTPTTAFAHTDAGRGELFAHRHRDIVRFCRDRGGWWFYDGRRWTTQGAFDICRQWAIKDARQMLIDAGKIDDDDRRRATIEYAVKCESAARVQATLSLAESMPSLMLTPDVFDADPYLLNCGNGTVDLRSGVLRPHAAADFITKLSVVEYDPKAELPVWREHLRRVLGDDAALMEFLQGGAGYSATGDTGEEVLFLVHGPAAGGKTTTIEALKTALGDYAVTCDFDTFLKRQAGGIRNDIARLAGARLVVSVEVDEGQTLAEGLVKQLTGGDKISARFLYEEFFEFKPQGKLWLVCNDAPKARDTDDALWRRILRVPFEHTIPKAERDPDIKRLLTNPDVGGPAVLAWIVAGCQQWRQTGLVVPSIIEDATRALREAQDPLRDFFDEECEFEDTAFVLVTEMRRAYEEYAKENGIRYPLGPKEFNKRLEARGCSRRTKRYFNDVGTEKVGKCWLGVNLQDQHQLREVEHELLP